MKQRCLLIILLMAVANGWAGWTLVQETREGILYVDREGTEKTAKGWLINTSADFHRAQQYDGKNYLSAKARYELDCTAKTMRSLNLDFFTENMGGGATVHAEQRASDWIAPEKGSQLEAIWSSMCQ